MNAPFRFSLITVAVLGLGACLGGSSSSKDEDDDSGPVTTTAFPNGLALASPTAQSSDSSPRLVAAANVGAATAYSGSVYARATSTISDLLAGTASAASVFDANLLMQNGSRAECYGPTLDYTSHPNAGAEPANGEFPSGDLGIWQEHDADGNACAAAELNAQLNGVSNRTIMGLMGLASMINVAKAASIALPSAGNSVDLLTEMNAVGIVNITFTTAMLSLSADGTTWSYSLALTFAQPNMGGNGTTNRDIVLSLTHKPGASENEFEGMFTYQVDSNLVGGNCGMVTTATTNGTLYYKRTSATAMFVNSREGGYCGSGVSAGTTTDADIDPTETYLFLDGNKTYNNGANANGWANNFAAFSGAFNPGTQEGNYVYAWQAGGMDDHSRVFQLGMNADAADGEAYFGFGDPVGTSDGSILGMICNWAGPGNNHTPSPYAQRQFFTFNATSGVFEVAAGGSDIVYAPTNSCAYEGSPSGFAYDRDVSGTIDGSDIALVYSTTAAPTGALDFDLMERGGFSTMQDAINDRNYVLPLF